MYFTDEKDYIMRMIKEMVRVLFSFSSSTETYFFPNKNQVTDL